MEQLKLGRSGLTVPRICLGTNNFGGQLDQDRCNMIMTAALDLGINMIDTANIYTGSKSEQIIGQFLKGRRDDIIVATKAGMENLKTMYGPPVADPNKMGSSRKNIIHQLEKSLSRLGTDYVDLFYIHQYDPLTPMDETMKTLDSLVKVGKIRYVACSNFSSSQIEESRIACNEFGLEEFIALQSEYNLLNRQIESDLIPYCIEKRIGVLAYSPLMGGLLAGRYQKASPPPSDSRGSYNQNYWKRVNKEINFSRVEKIKMIAEESRIPLPVMALSWILREEKVATAVVGASNPDQLQESCKALDTKLSASVIQKLEET